MTPDLITYGARKDYLKACREERTARKGERARASSEKRKALHLMLAAETGWKGVVGE